MIKAVLLLFLFCCIARVRSSDLIPVIGVHSFAACYQSAIIIIGSLASCRKVNHVQR